MIEPPLPPTNLLFACTQAPPLASSCTSSPIRISPPALLGETELLNSTMEFGRIEHFFELNCVDPDRVNAQGGAVPVATDMRELCFDPQKALHGVAEMTHGANVPLSSPR